MNSLQPIYDLVWKKVYGPAHYSLSKVLDYNIYNIYHRGVLFSIESSGVTAHITSSIKSKLHSYEFNKNN